MRHGLLTGNWRAAFFLICAPTLWSAQISGIVKDPSGLPIAKAVATLAQPGLLRPLTASTSSEGRFRFDNIAPGTYSLTVSHDGFAIWRRTVEAAAAPAELSVVLEIEAVAASVRVGASLRNSDPNYQALRNGQPRGVFRVHDLVLKRDVATLTFRSGAFSFAPPVLGRVTCAVFIGDGRFQLQPAVTIAADHLRRMSGASTVDEEFRSAVFYFSDSTYGEIMKAAEPADESPQPFRDALARLHEISRSRDYVAHTLLQQTLQLDDAPNLDAEILAELYNPAQRGSFRAFLHGRDYPQLRFVYNPSGALPGLSSPEEVALYNMDSGKRDGVWYLAHSLAEFQSGRASSSEDKRLIDPVHYDLQVAINTEGRLTVTCDLQFRSLADGTRVLKFDLLPDLQASRLALDGREAAFIQENRNRDGSFYATLPEPLEKGRLYRATFEYRGDFVNVQRGFQVRPRQAWYPRPPGNSRATYDMTFRLAGFTVVASGDPIRHAREQGKEVYQWSSSKPIPLAAFAEDDYTEKTKVDPETNTRVSVYLSNRPIPGPSPSFDVAFEEVENSIRSLQTWFGPFAYHNLAIAQEPGADSFPGLLFVPTTYMATEGQRYGAYISTLGRAVSLDSPLALAPSNVHTFGALNEGMARLTAGEWWGNNITPVSLHDRWLTDGMNNFAATAFDLAAGDSAAFLDHWRRTRDLLLSPGEMGESINDSGPAWMGILLDPLVTARSTAPPAVAGKRMTLGPGARPFASSAAAVVAAKGAFAIHMLRCLMFDSQTHDQDFIALLHDFSSRFANRAVSTENFKQLVEAHMKPALDLDGNGRMDWFFNQWIYGCELPSYRLEYSIGQVNGKTRASGRLTQSGVSEGFRMRVPIYAEFGKKAVVAGSMIIAGNHTGEFQVDLPEQPDSLALNVNYDVLARK